MLRRLHLWLLPLAATCAVAQVAALSPGNASYTIAVRLDPAQRLLHGSQRLRWTNLQEQPTDELPFHLYWNAWRNDRSTWMLEDRLRGRSDRGEQIAEQDWGWCRVLAMRLRPAGERPGADLTAGLRYASTRHQPQSCSAISCPRSLRPRSRSSSIQVLRSLRQAFQ